MNVPWHDPVVAEIHAVRERLEAQYHGDLAAYSAAAEAHCRELGLNMAGGHSINRGQTTVSESGLNHE